MIKRFLIAVQFLTILPVKIKSDIRGEDYGRSLVFFPFVGALVGFLLTLGVFLFSFLPQPVIAALVLIGSTIITGAIHLDGFLDTCDGLYGFKTRERALEIMRDSHVGAIAVLSVSLLFILKFSILANMPRDIMWRVLILALAFARWAQVAACFLSRYAREEGKAKCFIEHVTLRELVIGGIFTLMLFAFLLKLEGIILFFTSLPLALMLINYIKNKIKGMTGDTIGAISETMEGLVLLLGLVSWRISL